MSIKTDEIYIIPHSENMFTLYFRVQCSLHGKAVSDNSQDAIIASCYQDLL